VRQAFTPTADGVAVDLGPEERHLIGLALAVLSGYGGDPADPATSRLTYDAHPGDPEKSAAFDDLVEGELESARRDDRTLFSETLDSDRLDAEQADCWLRVVGEARLVLGARLDIEEDGWSDDQGDTDVPEMILLRFLSAVQDELVVALLGGL